mmetsp:Transcript_21140/g.44438  ORF Transcript_21140/g.44438 Transcript_21140/m.44438 type:complete len:271 (+) Transcript_21140:533-1345(+)
MRWCLGRTGRGFARGALRQLDGLSDQRRGLRTTEHQLRGPEPILRRVEAPPGVRPGRFLYQQRLCPLQAQRTGGHRPIQGQAGPERGIFRSFRWKGTHRYGPRCPRRDRAGSQVLAQRYGSRREHQRLQRARVLRRRRHRPDALRGLFAGRKGFLPGRLGRTPHREDPPGRRDLRRSPRRDRFVGTGLRPAQQTGCLRTHQFGDELFEGNHLQRLQQRRRLLQQRGGGACRLRGAGRYQGQNRQVRIRNLLEPHGRQRQRQRDHVPKVSL